MPPVAFLNSAIVLKTTTKFFPVLSTSSYKIRTSTSSSGGVPQPCALSNVALCLWSHWLQTPVIEILCPTRREALDCFVFPACPLYFGQDRKGCIAKLCEALLNALFGMPGFAVLHLCCPSPLLGSGSNCCAKSAPGSKPASDSDSAYGSNSAPEVGCTFESVRDSVCRPALGFALSSSFSSGFVRFVLKSRSAPVVWCCCLLYTSPAMYTAKCPCHSCLRSVPLAANCQHPCLDPQG